MFSKHCLLMQKKLSLFEDHVQCKWLEGFICFFLSTLGSQQLFSFFYQKLKTIQNSAQKQSKAYQPLEACIYSNLIKLLGYTLKKSQLLFLSFLNYHYCEINQSAVCKEILATSGEFKLIPVHKLFILLSDRNF